MAKKEVTVVINGEETVSEAASQADGALGGFISKIPGWAKGVALLAAAYQTVSAAVSAVKDFVLDSISAYDDYATAQSKLTAVSKMTGTPLRELHDIVRRGREEFGLSSVAAGELTGAVARFAEKAGDSSRASDLMAKALEIGAASGMNATQVAEGLTSALAGNDEWLNKIGLSNPSVIWEEYAAANGIAKGEIDDTTKALAVMNAIMDAGEKVTGTLAERMEAGAGAQDRLNNKLGDAKIAFGAAIQPARVLVINGLTMMLDVLSPLIVGLAKFANLMIETVVGSLKLAQSAAGAVVLAIGKLTGNDALVAWGERNSMAMDEYVKRLSKMEAQSSLSSAAVTEQGRAHQLATVQITASADAVKKHAETSEQAATRLNAVLDKKLGEPMSVAIGLTEGAITRLGQAAVAQLPADQSQRFLTHMQGLVVASEEARNRMLGIKDGATNGAARTKDMAREVESFARGAIDAASAFGVIDETAQRSLNSAVSIASAIGNMAKSGLSFAGVTGVIGGVASIVSTMMQGDAERKRLLKQNNEALDRLRKDIGGLNLRISGDTLVSAQSALAGVVGNLRGGRGAANENDVRNALYAQGLSMEDFDRIAKEFGIEVRTKSGALNVDSVKAVFDALKTVQLGKVGSDFQSQLDFFTQGQDIGNEQGTTRATNLLNFLLSKGNVGALGGLDLTDPAKLREQLIALRGQLNSAQGIDESQLGKLSGGQFNDILVSLLGMLNSGTPTGGGGDVTVPTGGGGGTTSVPSETIQSVIKAMDNNLASILTSHTVIHERIAIATESSALSLTSIDAKMDTLIAVSAGTDRIDAALEAERRLLAVQQGTPVTF